MASDWTPQEIRAAEEEIDDNSNAGTPWREVTTEVICQRNRALAALDSALNLFAPDHAICRFNWGASGLRAEDIRELNETPGIIRAAIAACKKGDA